MLIKQKNLSLPRNLTLATFGESLSVLNLLYLVYLTDLKCCLLFLTEQNCLQKTSLRTLILMTRVSLYLLFLLDPIWNCTIWKPIWNWGSYIVSITKTSFKKTRAFIRFMRFLSLDVALYLYKSTIVYYHIYHINLPGNTVLMSGRVPLVANWICYNLQKRCVGLLLVQHLLLLLNPWIIVEI